MSGRRSRIHERSVKWILGIGILILLGSSLMLVTAQGDDDTPVWKSLILLGYTAGIHGLGQLSYHSLALRKTGTSLTVLLIQITLLAPHWMHPAALLSWFGLFDQAGLLTLLRGEHRVFAACIVENLRTPPATAAADVRRLLFAAVAGGGDCACAFQRAGADHVAVPVERVCCRGDKGPPAPVLAGGRASAAPGVRVLSDLATFCPHGGRDSSVDAQSGENGVTVAADCSRGHLQVKVAGVVVDVVEAAVGSDE